MIETNLLWILLVIPIAASILAAVLGPRQIIAIRWISLGATAACALLALILAVCLLARPAGGTAEADAVPSFAPSYVTRAPLLPLGPGTVEFFIGLDGLNVWLVVLTAVLMVPSVLVSWQSFQVQERINEYFAWLLALETGMIGVFVS